MWYRTAWNDVDSLSGNLGNIIFRMEMNVDWIQRKCPDQAEVATSLFSDLEQLKRVKAELENMEAPDVV